MDIYDVFKKAMLTVLGIALLFGLKVAIRGCSRGSRGNDQIHMISPAFLAHFAWNYESDLGEFQLGFDQDGTLFVGGTEADEPWELDGRTLSFELEGEHHGGFMMGNSLQGNTIGGDTRIDWEAFPEPYEEELSR